MDLTLHPLKQPLRWLLTAASFGALATLPVALAFSERGVSQLGLSCGIGATFSVVMWGGGVLLGPWIFPSAAGRSPSGYALLSQLRWLATYTALFAFCVLFSRVALGVRIGGTPRQLLIMALVGYLISSVILGLRLTAMVAEKARELEKARAQASLLALRAQLSPHTLFNGLNTVAALIPEDPRAAEAVVEGLSRLLRRILEALAREQWTLAEEFDLLQALLDLERARFGDRLKVDLVLPAECEHRPVPPLLLLPLVENSLKHGFRPKVGPCHLVVRASEGAITVVDDGVGRDPAAPEGVGLCTVRQRLEAQRGSLRWLDASCGSAVEVRPWP